MSLAFWIFRMERRRLPRGIPDRRLDSEHRHQCARWLTLADVALRLGTQKELRRRVIFRSRELAKRAAALIERANQLAMRNHANKIRARHPQLWSLRNERRP